MEKKRSSKTQSECNRVIVRIPKQASPSQEVTVEITSQEINQIEDIFRIIGILEKNKIEVIPVYCMPLDQQYVLAEEFCCCSGERDEAMILCLQAFYDSKNIHQFGPEEQIHSQDIVVYNDKLLISQSKRTTEQGIQKLIAIAHTYGMEVRKVDRQDTINMTLFASIKVEQEDIEKLHCISGQVLASSEANLREIKLSPLGISISQSVSQTTIKVQEGLLEQVFFPTPLPEKPLRPLSWQEGSKLKFNFQALIQCMQIVPFLTYIEGPKFDTQIFNLALKKLIDQHPQFRMTYQVDDTISFRYLKNSYFEATFIKGEDKNEPIRYAEKVMDQKSLFSPGDNPFQIHVFEYTGLNVLMITFLHIYCDGIGAQNLTDQILKNYVRLRKEGDFIQESYPFIESSEDMLFPNGYSEEQLKKISTRKDQYIQAMREIKDIFPFDKSAGETKNVMLVRDGTKENLQKLASKCKEYGVTIGTLLLATAFFAHEKFMYKEYLKKDFLEANLSAEFDVNLRDRYPIPINPNLIGTHYGLMIIDTKLTKDTSLWEVAQCSNKIARDILKSEEYFLEFSVIQEVEKEKSKKENEIEGGQICQVFLSNVGKYKYNPIHSDGVNEFKVIKQYCSTGILTQHLQAISIQKYPSIMSGLCLLNFKLMLLQLLKEERIEKEFRKYLICGVTSLRLATREIQALLSDSTWMKDEIVLKLFIKK